MRLPIFYEKLTHKMGHKVRFFKFYGKLTLTISLISRIFREKSCLEVSVPKVTQERSKWASLGIAKKQCIELLWIFAWRELFLLVKTLFWSFWAKRCSKWGFQIFVKNQCMEPFWNFAWGYSRAKVWIDWNGFLVKKLVLVFFDKKGSNMSSVSFTTNWCIDFFYFLHEVTEADKFFWQNSCFGILGIVPGMMFLSFMVNGSLTCF